VPNGAFDGGDLLDRDPIGGHAQARTQLRTAAAALEDRWRAEVGEERYAVFRNALVQLAD